MGVHGVRAGGGWAGHLEVLATGAGNRGAKSVLSWQHRVWAGGCWPDRLATRAGNMGGPHVLATWAGHTGWQHGRAIPACAWGTSSSPCCARTGAATTHACPGAPVARPLHRQQHTRATAPSPFPPSFPPCPGLVRQLLPLPQGAQGGLRGLLQQAGGVLREAREGGRGGSAAASWHSPLEVPLSPRGSSVHAATPRRTWPRPLHLCAWSLPLCLVSEPRARRYLWAHPTPLDPCARCFLPVCQVANASVAELMATFCDNLLKKASAAAVDNARLFCLFVCLFFLSTLNASFLPRTLRGAVPVAARQCLPPRVGSSQEKPRFLAATPCHRVLLLCRQAPAPLPACCLPLQGGSEKLGVEALLSLLVDQPPTLPPPRHHHHPHTPTPTPTPPAGRQREAGG